jgi:hypothetical protein
MLSSGHHDDPPPIPVLPLDYAPTDSADRVARWRWWVRALVVAGAVVCAAGWLLIVFTHVESVILTGPALAAVGAFLAACGWRARDWRGLFLGVAHVAVCVLFVALVNMLPYM